MRTKITDWAREAIESQKRRKEREQAQAEQAKAREVYDRPPDDRERAEMRIALAVDHGAPWLRATVDVIRQLRGGHMETIAGRPGSPEATEAGYRYSELVRAEFVLLEAVDKARVRESVGS
jgi:hypothetical protein